LFVKNTSLYRFIYILSACGAISIMRIPLQWLAISGVLFCTLYFYFKKKVKTILNIKLFLIFIFYNFIITFIGIGFNELTWPIKASTPMFFFIFLRFLNIFVFYFFLIWTTDFLSKNNNEINNFVVNIGFIIALISIYVYIAQIYGLPDIPRSRSGTSGGEQSTTFSGYFHRAMGTFREPSHLAEWLILPILYSYNLNKIFFQKLIFILLLFLTGSLTAIVSLLLAFILYYIFKLLFIIFNYKAFINNTTFKFKNILYFIPIITIIIICINFILDNQIFIIANAIYNRVDDLNNTGISKSNRDYIYEYLSKNSISFWGNGIGIANLKLSSYMDSDVVVSFLSLYYNTIYSSGIFGLSILFIFLIYPIYYYINSISKNVSTYFNDDSLKYYFLAYLTWLIMFIVSSEELTLSFAVAYGSLVYFSNQSLNERN
jgi:hypothetical protein